MDRRRRIASWSIAALLIALAWFAGRAILESGSPRSLESPHADGTLGRDESLSPDRRAPEPAADTSSSPSNEHAARQVTGVPADAAPAVMPVRIRVVERESGRPVSAAHVVLCTSPLALKPLEQALTAPPFDLEAVLSFARASERFETSAANGEALFEREPVRALAIARAEGAWGWNWVERDSNVQVVEIAEDGDLAVRVFNPVLAPVVGLELFLCCGTSLSELRTERFLSARTDANGIARFLHGRWWIERQPSESFVLVAQALLRDPAVLSIDRAALGEELVLNLPDTGSVAVNVPERSAEVDFAAIGHLTDPDGDPFELTQRVSKHGLVARLSEGRARFGFVETGLELLAVASGPDPQDLELRARGSGPRLPREHVEIELCASSLLPLLAGRALDASGAPIALGTIAVLGVARGRGSVERQCVYEFRTDREGRFSFPLALGTESGEVGLVFTLANLTPPLVGEVDLPRGLPPGIHGLGDVILTPLSAIVTGRVIDERLEPVPDAVVSHSGVRGADIQRPHGAVDTQHAEGRTDANGRFALWSRATGGTVDLYASAEGFLDGTVELVLVGARDLEVILERAGAIGAEVLLDERLRCSDVEAYWILDPVPPPREPPWVRAGVEPRPRGGRFSLQKLKPGFGNIVLWLANGAQLYASDSIEIRGGDSIELDPIDLRGSKDLFAVCVFSPTQLAADQLEVLFRLAGTRGWISARTHEGRVVFSTLIGPLDLLLEAPECRTACLESVQTDREIHLRPGIVAEVVLADRRLLPAEPHELAVVLEPILNQYLEGRRQFREPTEGIFDSQGRARLSLSIPGDHRLRWSIVTSTAGSRHTEGRQSKPPQTLEIRDTEVVQKFEVAPPPDILAWLEEFGSR